MRHLDLFSGLGCWALASAEVWPDREMVGFVENDPFCQEVLARRFPNAKRYGDIKEFHWPPADSDGAQQPQQSGGGAASGGSASEPRSGPRPRTGVGDRGGDTSKRVRELATGTAKLYDIDLLTGSPPCQSASTAGKRRGTGDARWLWDEAIRVLGETRPRYAIFENVPGLLSLEGGVPFEAVCAQMENEGYEVWPLVLPAASVGAPHRRDRVWIVARANAKCVSGPGWRETEDLAGAKGETKTKEEERKRMRDASDDGGSDAPDTTSAGLPQPGQAGERELSAQSGEGIYHRPQLDRGWHRDWREVAWETCWEDEAKPGVCGVDDGAPALLYGPRKLSEAAHRRERLKALGNAIYFPVAVEIMKAIKHADDQSAAITEAML